MKKCIVVLLNTESLKKKDISGMFDEHTGKVFIPLMLPVDSVYDYDKFSVCVDNQLFDIEQISGSVFCIKGGRG